MIRPFRHSLFAGTACLALGLQGCDSSAGSNSAATGRDSVPVAKTIDSSRLPLVATILVKEINRTQATVEGEVGAQPGYDVQAMGICWSQASHPTVSDHIVVNGSGSIRYSLVLHGLQPGTTYHTRAWATNGIGTAYGRDIEFQTSAELAPPTCATTTNSARLNGFTRVFTTVAGTRGLSRGTYGLVGSDLHSELQAGFNREPKTGLYETATTLAPFDSTHVTLVGVVDNALYEALPGQVVSVVKRGDGAYSVSFCEVAFLIGSQGSEFVSSGNLTSGN